jgi:hypothetical protein
MASIRESEFEAPAVRTGISKGNFATGFWRRAEPGGNGAPSNLVSVQRFGFQLLLAIWASIACGQPAPQATPLTAAAGQGLVDRALANELKAAQDASHPMRYRLRKTSPRLTTTKEILETRDGEVARLLAINDQPLSAEDAQKEDARLNELLADPEKQRHRKQAEDQDAGRALMVLRALPSAFLYQYAGPVDGPAGRLEKFTFQPNPSYAPQNLETEVLTAMNGEILIDPASQRVERLEGHLQQDVDFGWGILGRLNKGGWIAIDQADVGDGDWRIVHFKMQMSGRVFFKTRVFDTAEEESKFVPLAMGLSYQRAIEIARADANADSK